MHRRARTVFLFASLLLSFATPTLYAQQTEAELQAQLQGLEREIKELSNNIESARKQGIGLKSDITLLEKKIEESRAKIRATQSKITRLNSSINDKNESIALLDEKLEREKESLSQILRKKEHLEAYTLLDFTLQEKTLSSFFGDRDSYATLERALSNSFEEIRVTRNDIESAKEELEDAKDEELARKLIQEAERKKVEQNQKEKNSLLQATKGQEAKFQKVLVARQAEAAKIRARLFALRDSESIQFGQAYDYALIASRSTGVRPSLILAILMQESSLGKNTGSCFVTNYQTGEGVSKSGTAKQRVMSPTRDVPVFLDIVRRLGRDPNKTQVSCWIPMYSKGQPYGWGGAMGPAQFIPSTWKLFEDRVEAISGASVADPWNASHAIDAMALYLKDLGAVSGDEASERNAACRYYSGRSCSRSSDGASYGNSVMKKLYDIQKDIDTLQKA